MTLAQDNPLSNSLSWEQKIPAVYELCRCVALCGYLHTDLHAGNFFVEKIPENQTIGRDKDSNDTHQPEDWENATSYADPFGIDRSTENGSTPGLQNWDLIPEFSDIFIPVTVTMALFVILRKKIRKKSKGGGNPTTKKEDRK